jgi:flavin prenyltransferase
MIIVAITGASGIIYALRLLKVLKGYNIEISLIITEPAKKILKHELKKDMIVLEELSDEIYEPKDLNASINSGSYRFNAMIIIPCTMKTISAISTGYANNTITRAADVALKEKRKLILVPRETPLRAVHLENMLKISREGGIILPAMPAFYHNPETIDDMVNFIVGKILDILDIENNLFKRWNGEEYDQG